ncbi:MAG: TPM domain-containing protein [Alistipes sp.]|nr:TPM domain-containing protein [Alistipes sp.]
MKNLRRYLILAGLLLLFAAPVLARAYRTSEVPNVQLVDRTRFVSNPDGILSREAVATIDRICDSLRQARLAEVAVVAVREIHGGDPFAFAIRLFSEWGVGRADGDNGLGILLVEGMHEIRFVTGDGLEGVLPDAICKRIQMNYMLPWFRRGDYSQGMVAGVEAVAQQLQGADPLPEEEAEVELWALLLAVVALPLIFLFLVWYLAVRCPRCHRPSLQLTDQQVTTTKGLRLTQYTYRCKHCGKEVKRDKTEYTHFDNNHRSGGLGGPFIGGFGGGRGFGGGSMGGGFGGGHFGGGGAGSRW